MPEIPVKEVFSALFILWFKQSSEAQKISDVKFEKFKIMNKKPLSVFN